MTQYYCSKEDLDELVEILVVKLKYQPKDLLAWLDRVKNLKEREIRKGNAGNIHTLANFTMENPFPCNIELFIEDDYKLPQTKFLAVKDYIQNPKSFKQRFWNSVKQVANIERSEINE
jgi:hypothetical protein